jgi:cytidylate kinase
MADSAPVLTLDGPSGVGKGTLCCMLASELGWHILDSGSLYRLVALVVDRSGVLDDDTQIVEIARTMKVKHVAEDGQLKVFLDTEDVSDKIRSEKIGEIASRIAVIPELRQALLTRQRVCERLPGLVADGRDMGTMVFPRAELKIFLTASQDVRAKRRYKQLKGKGIDANLPQLVIELKQRDERDASRTESPLVAADDAVVVDTTSLSVEDVFNEVMKLVERRFK